MIQSSSFFPGFNENSSKFAGTPSRNENAVVYLFVAFDLYGFTSFKAQNKSSWASAIQVFWDVLKKNFDGVDYWKFNGDELLFKKSISSLIEIRDVVHAAHRCMGLLEATFSDVLKKRVYIRAGAWLANIEDMSSADLDKSAWNYRLISDTAEDFVGINMDEGFRMLSCASRSLFLIDPKIAYMFNIVKEEVENFDNVNRVEDSVIDKLVDSEECPKFIDAAKIFAQNAIPKRRHDMKIFASNLAFVGYTHCKGVWNNRMYPIIWYSNDWEHDHPQIHYDDMFSNDYVKDIVAEIKSRNEGREKLKDLKELKSVFNHVEAHDNVYKILNLLNIDNPHVNLKSITVPPKLNYVVVCVTPCKNKALMFKRSTLRNHLKETWDFGTSRHTSVDEISKTIRQDYLQNFGINIAIEGDKRRCQEIRPFAFCQIPRNGYRQNVVLCFGLIEDELLDCELTENIKRVMVSSDKYCDVALVSMDDLTFNEDSGESWISVMQNNGQAPTLLKCLTEDEVELDSQNFAKKNQQQSLAGRVVVNGALSIKEALVYYQNEDMK